MSTIDPKAVLVCRSAMDVLMMGADKKYFLGYQCHVCEQPLALSSKGKEQVDSGIVIDLFCNNCGLAFAQFMEKNGKGFDVATNPGAAEQIERLGDHPLARYLRERIKK